MPKLRGHVSVSCSDMKHAYQFAKAYIPIFRQSSETIFDEVEASVAAKLVGKRTAARILWLVPISQNEANALAKRQVRFSVLVGDDEETLHHKRILKNARQLASDANVMDFYVGTLRILASSKSDIQLDIDGFSIVNQILALAKKNNFDKV